MRVAGSPATLGSGSPTIVKTGQPNETSTSMFDGWTLRCRTTAAERTHASILRALQSTAHSDSVECF